ncbi:hypothetical protein F5Y16DRAFT_371881 [Xylariaceae sp. FL0255]|nr:hypothetical protein F5Y16DRAFT_371881 [Xylariaceae sp. FL0255]
MSAISPVMNGRGSATIAHDVAERLHMYQQVDGERQNFIQAMMQTIESNSQKIAELERDLRHQNRARAQYQSEAERLENDVQNLSNRLSTNSYVVVLIDGDGAKFRNEFLRDHENGGFRAALKLKDEVKAIRESSGLNHEIPILVRVYANLNDLAKSLRFSGVIDFDDSMRLFAEQFTNTHVDCDFINVGKGKENADNKIRNQLGHFHQNVQCHQIFVAGCCHDNGYLHDLRPFAGRSDNKIVLLETTPAEQGFKSLGIPIHRFDSVFRSEPLNNETKHTPQAFPFRTRSPPGFSTAQPPSRLAQNLPDLMDTIGRHPRDLPDLIDTIKRPAQLPDLIDTISNSRPELRKQTPSTSSVAESPIQTTSAVERAPPPQVKSPPVQPPTRNSNVVNSGNGGISISYATAGGNVDHQNVTVKAAKPKKQPKYAYYREDQSRLDSSTQHPPRTRAQETYQTKFQNIKPSVFCNDHYLRGRCKWGAACDKTHDIELTTAELAIHRYKARTSLCPNGPFCVDYDCYLSHHCPRTPCTRGDQCPFANTQYGDLHYAKEEMKPHTKWTEGVEFPEYV